MSRTIETRDRDAAEALGNDVRRHFRQYPDFDQASLTLLVGLPAPIDRDPDGRGVADRYAPIAPEELRREEATLLIGVEPHDELLRQCPEFVARSRRRGRRPPPVAEGSELPPSSEG